MKQQGGIGNRKLRIFAFDPSLGRRLGMLAINEITVAIPSEMDSMSCEAGAIGAVGEYLEIVDVDPASECAYPPIDLNDPDLLAKDGLDPDESDPRFHQQMVYAVAMKTIAHFEQALGRCALWAPRVERVANGKFLRQRYVQRLRVYPHALRDANAYYSPRTKTILMPMCCANGLTTPCWL